MPNRGNERVVYIAFGVIFIIAIVVLLSQRMCGLKCKDAKFEASSLNVTTDEVVTFTDKSNSKAKDPDVGWDFEDDHTHETGKTVRHKFNRTGKFNVTLTLFKSNSCSSTQQIRVTPGEVIPLDTQPKIMPAMHCPPVAIVGKPAKFRDETPAATKWEWTFDNGKGYADVREPSYTFETPGKTTVLLVVNGNSKTASCQVKVINPPPANTGGGASLHKPNKQLPPPIPPAQFISMLRGLRTGSTVIKSFSPYLCNDLSQQIIVNGTHWQFDAFCNEFMLYTKTKITDLHFNVDPDTNCIIDLVIEEK